MLFSSEKYICEFAFPSQLQKKTDLDNNLMSYCVKVEGIYSAPVQMTVITFASEGRKMETEIEGYVKVHGKVCHSAGIDCLYMCEQVKDRQRKTCQRYSIWSRKANKVHLSMEYLAR